MLKNMGDETVEYRDISLTPPFFQIIFELVILFIFLSTYSIDNVSFKYIIVN